MQKLFFTSLPLVGAVKLELERTRGEVEIAICMFSAGDHNA